MKRLIAGALLALSTLVHAQVITNYVPGQVLSAASLNAAFVQAVNIAGSTMTGPLTVPTLTINSPLTVANGGTGVSVASGTALDNITGFAGTGYLQRTGAGTYTFSATVPPSGLAAQAANTVLANATASSASPTAVALPSCSTSSSALGYTSGTGFACNTSVNAATLGGATFAAPGPVGSTTASTGAFTTLSASSTVSGTGFSTYLASPPAIGSTAASTGAFTTLSASSTVSGTGFSTYLASPPAIGGTTAAAGKFTTLQATSTITPSTTSGIVGTTLADNANAGSDGEYQTANTTGTSLTSGTAFNATSITLTAGDWDVSGTVIFNAASTTVPTGLSVGISTTSATLVLGGGTGQTNSLIVTFAASSINYMATPVVRINVSTSTTVYLVGQASFTTSTMTGAGFIRARRVR